MKIDVENVESKECGIFDVELNHISYEDGTYEWQVKVIWNDGAYPNNITFDNYEDAINEYRNWDN